MSIQRYTVGELRDLIDQLLSNHEIELDSRVLIADYEGNCESNGNPFLSVYADEGKLYLCCDFNDDMTEEAFERACRALQNLNEKQSITSQDEDTIVNEGDPLLSAIPEIET